MMTESLSPSCGLWYCFELLNDDEEKVFRSVYDDRLRSLNDAENAIKSSKVPQQSKDRASLIEFNKEKTIPHECSLALLEAEDTDNTILQVIKIVNIEFLYVLTR